MIDERFRAQLVRLLDWEEAHVGFDKAVDGIPADRRGSRAAGFEHSPWQLLEHMRLAQEDILEFSRSTDYTEKRFPDDYWPTAEVPPNPDSWDKSVKQFQKDLKAMQKLVSDARHDLLAEIPHGQGQTLLREALLVADHNAYHLGQLDLVRRLIGAWPEEG